MKILDINPNTGIIAILLIVLCTVINTFILKYSLKISLKVRCHPIELLVCSLIVMISMTAIYYLAGISAHYAPAKAYWAIVAIMIGALVIVPGAIYGHKIQKRPGVSIGMKRGLSLQLIHLIVYLAIIIPLVTVKLMMHK